MVAPSSEMNRQFIDAMDSRMEVSFHKYGPIKKAFPHKVNAIATLKARLQQYLDTGNTEFLIDVANYAMIEFTLPAHPKAHFEPTDDVGSPGRKWHAGGPMTAKGNEG